MKVLNTLSRELEEFVPMEAGKVRMYTCGPTVYDFAHIGNFRTYIFEDILRRYLKYLGFEVMQAMNLTDVDDKTIRGSRAARMALRDYTQRYKDSFFADLDELGIERAEEYPAATDHVREMIELIVKLEEKGHAYRSGDGSVYFRISSFPGYGKLAHLDMAGLKAGARVSHDEYDKDDLADFALWKAWEEEDGEVAWDSPWGRGRPGWHIECSAMSMKYLGETFDIHTGGIDNMFPHHEDEIAQSEGATGRQFVRYWLHSAHLVVEGKKMSKSLGNFFTLRQLVERGYTGRQVRYVLACAQYRQTLNFTMDSLIGARASLQRIDEFVDRVKALGCGVGTGTGLPAWAGRALERFEAGMDADLNVPESIASVFGMVHDGNRAMDANEFGGDSAAVLALLERMDTVLGFLMRRGSGAEMPWEVARLAGLRAQARKARNWGDSDRLRDELAGLGWEARDTSNGQALRKL